MHVAEKMKPPEISCWVRPPVGVFKLNVDAAVFKDYIVLAVVAQDDQGLVF
jgi:hypothetical protein